MLRSFCILTFLSQLSFKHSSCVVSGKPFQESKQADAYDERQNRRIEEAEILERRSRDTRKETLECRNWNGEVRNWSGESGMQKLRKWEVGKQKERLGKQKRAQL
jgi:hypothetical protein